MRSWKKFKEPLPLTKESCSSKFNDESISDEDLENEKNVCNFFWYYKFR